MATQIYVNLPVKDLDRSKQFFSKLGFHFNSQFTDEKATCMVVTDDIYIMLLVEPFFKTFTHKEVSDAKKSTEVIVTLSSSTRESVNDMVNKAVEAGGIAPHDPKDHGWMYQHGFQDLDGHLWELIYMDMEAFEKQNAASSAAHKSRNN